MLFNSYPFLFLVLITFILYYIPRFKNIQLYILTLSSFIFYSYHAPILLLLLILSGTINAVSSYIVFHSPKPPARKTAAVTGVIFNLLVLGAFKYNGMLGELLIETMDVKNGLVDLFVLLPLPIGISFYTFQGISLLVDIYRQGRGDPEPWHIEIPESFVKHYRDTLFFISFFPQLIAGPIVKAHDFLPQIATKYLKNIDWEYTFKILILGYFLKMVVADNLQNQTFWIGFYDIQSTLTLLVTMFGYSVQIFADFAGYSLIAIGVASLFGYRLPQNFDFPYISSSFSEFWKRWHMTLGLWLKEYLYIPLGGNRKGTLRNYLNLMVVMVLGGLWHGASLSYVSWGTYHGVLLVSERIFAHYITLPRHQIFRILQIVTVFSLVTVGWLFFQLDIQGFEGFFRALVHNTSIDHNRGVLLMVFLYSLPVFLYYLHHIGYSRYIRYRTWFGKNKSILYGILLFAIIFQSGNSSAFIYFQF